MNRAAVGLPMAPHENDAHRSIETLAAAHLEILQAELPRGPYVFCGHSFAGLVAFEMAQQSAQAGHHVVLLALFDTLAPDRRWLTARLPTRVHLRRARRRGWRRGASYLRGIVTDRFGQTGNGTPPGLDRELMSAVYRPRPYRARMALLVTAANAAAARDPLLGWGDHAQQPIDVVAVPGDHRTMLQEPLVTALADGAAAAIHRADNARSFGHSG